ncbi:MAG TPA: bacteriophage holin [Acidobacteriaceae bacterium]|nr:bacteriophage holin [Acidobacteriaceae bacterium]
MDASTAGTATNGGVRKIKCSPSAAGISVGLLWACAIFFLGITAIFGWGAELVKVFASLYIGYAASFAGAIIGALWAFVDGYIAGAVGAWLYNFFTRSSVA